MHSIQKVNQTIIGSNSFR